MEPGVLVPGPGDVSCGVGQADSPRTWGSHRQPDAGGTRQGCGNHQGAPRAPPGQATAAHTPTPASGHCSAALCLSQRPRADLLFVAGPPEGLRLGWQALEWTALALPLGTLRLQWRRHVRLNPEREHCPLCSVLLQPKPSSSRKPSSTHPPTAIVCRKPAGMWAFSPYLEPRLLSVELVLSCGFIGVKSLCGSTAPSCTCRWGGLQMRRCSAATVMLRSICHPKRAPPPSASSFLPGPAAGSHNLLSVTTALPLPRCCIQEILGYGTRVFPSKMSLRSPQQGALLSVGFHSVTRPQPIQQVAH